MSSADKGPSTGPVTTLWSWLASERTTAVLVLLLASFVLFVTAFVPQGKDAIESARSPAAVVLQQLVAWGLTDVFRSAWVKALGVLIGANLVAMAVSGLVRRRGAKVRPAVPKGAPFQHEIEAKFPENTVEVVRDTLTSRLGDPVAESASGPKAVMVFDASSTAQLAPIFRLLGLLVLIVAAGLHASERDGRDTIPSAILEVTDRRTGTKGTFDMAGGEAFTFFQYPAKYFVVGYTRAKGNMGPALRIERRAQGQQRGEVFWVYESAPEGFDERHRTGDVSIKSIWMGRRAVPGSGLADSPVAGLLILGMAGLLFGAFAGRGAPGRVWVEAEGRRVTLLGVPQHEGDSDFERHFARWALEAESDIKSI